LPHNYRVNCLSLFNVTSYIQGKYLYSLQIVLLLRTNDIDTLYKRFRFAKILLLIVIGITLGALINRLVTILKGSEAEHERKYDASTFLMSIYIELQI
jgi:hypothetical protein